MADWLDGLFEILHRTCLGVGQVVQSSAVQPRSLGALHCTALSRLLPALCFHVAYVYAAPKFPCQGTAIPEPAAQTLLEAIYEDGSEEPPGPYSSSANGHNGASREAGSAIASFDEADALRRIGAAPGGYVLGESMAQRRKPREAAFETLHD